jgi:selenide,water dikinase
MIGNLSGLAGGGEKVLVGPQSSDDAGVYLHGETALVATADFITPVCDDPHRFGRVAAANSISDIYAMGGRPLFALNLCCFPDKDLPDGVAAAILEGAAEMLGSCDAALLGGHSVSDSDLKFGLAVIGEVDRDRILTNGGALPGDRLVLTKPLGTGVLINAFKAGRLDEAGLEPALVEMERLNDKAAGRGLEHGAHAATDITGFGLAGHAMEVARGSGVRIRLEFAALPVHERFYEMVAAGVTTGATRPNRRHVAPGLEDRLGLNKAQSELLHDPQTSGGLLLSVPAENAGALVADLVKDGHAAVDIGEVRQGEPGLEIV